MKTTASGARGLVGFLLAVSAVASGEHAACAANAAAPGESPAVFAPLDWGAVKPGGPAHKRMEQAVRELAKARDALSALLDQRMAADAAKEPPVDVLLDLSEAMVSYANCQVRPMPGTAPQWRNAVGAVLGRIHTTKEEFAPAHEDVRLSLAQRGGRWIGPRIGMVSSKFLQQFHLCGGEFADLRAGPAGIGGNFVLTSVRGDFRYDMHFSGESTTCTLPEFKQIRDYEGHSSWPDWWAGPRERMWPWEQHFAVDAGRRRGWILKAMLLSPDETAPGTPCRDVDVFAWIEDGRLLRGYFIIPDRLPGRGPELLVTLNRWSLKDNTLEAQFDAGHGSRKQVYELRGALADSEGGAVTGTYRAAAPRGETHGVMQGTLYRAFAGTYTTKGLDGEWTGEALAGLAPAPRPEPMTSEPAIIAGTEAVALFRSAVEIYRQVAALDWALREYPLPLAEALRRVREGQDDRFCLWPPNLAWHYRATRRHLSPAASAQMHEALAAGLGRGDGAASYLEALARIGCAALAERKARTPVVVGIPDTADADFGPSGGWSTMERDDSRGNLLPPSTDNSRADWRAIGDWTCFGFISRYAAFQGAPLLPEIAVECGLRPSGAALEVAHPVRIPHPDAGVHYWCWRANPDPVDGAITIPRGPLLPTREQRQRWGGGKGTGVSGETLDYYYHNLAAWYATATIHAAKPSRVWLAVKVDWDGRLWVNDVLVWRPARPHTPNRLAVLPLDLVAGPNRLTVCCSPRPVEDGNSGNFGAYVFKYGPKAMGSFAVWVSHGGKPRGTEAVATAAAKEQAADRQVATATAARGIRGPRGDGSARYPDARPPLAWDIEKGINVRWKTALPTDDAEAVVVGKRLFVTTYTGELACLDAATGGELWRKKPAVEGGNAPAPYPPQAITASCTMSSLLWRTVPPKTADVAAGGTVRIKPHEALGRSCLTPLADTRRVWMHDPRGAVACFDHDGRQIWAQAVPAQTPRFTEGGYIATRVLPPTPPAVVGSMLLVAVGEGMAAFDLDSGAERWRRPRLDYLGQFAAMDLGDGSEGQLVLLSSGEVLGAVTGQTLISRCAPLIPDAACRPVVEGRVAWFHAASSAVRFWLDEGGKVHHRLLWDSPGDIRRRQMDMNHGNHNGPGTADFFCQGAYPPAPVVHDGLLFTHMAEPCSIERGPQNSMRCQVSDAATGCAVSQRYCIQINAMRPATSTVLAGGMLFCADEGGKRAYNYPGFPSDPAIAIVTAEQQPRRVANNQPGLATLSPPTFDGRRMYLAGSDRVVCTERPESLGERFSDHELAALREGFYSHEIGDRPGPQSLPLVPFPLERLPEGIRTPVVPLILGGFPHHLLGAWPLGDHDVDNPYAAMAGQSGAVVSEGVKITVGGDKAEFRPVPDEGITEAAVGKRGDSPAAKERLLVDYLWFNLPVGTWPMPGLVPSLGLSPQALLGDRTAARGYFFAVLSNRRALTVEFDCPEGVRAWLSGKQIGKGDRVRLAPGLYPLLIECRVTAQSAQATIAPSFREVADPAIELDRWLARVTRNTDLLRAIAASGPGGAYARDALESLEQAQRNVAPQGADFHQQESRP
jgi:hypothetical protein